MIIASDVVEWVTSSTGGSVPALSEADEALLDRVVAGVAKHIARTHTAPETEDDTDARDWEQAHLMQSARLWQRRETPNGIGGFGEFGAVRVTSLDPDVAQLLAPFRVWAFS